MILVNIRTYLKIKNRTLKSSLSFRLARNLSLFSVRFPTRFACGNDILIGRTHFVTGSNNIINIPEHRTGIYFNCKVIPDKSWNT